MPGIEIFRISEKIYGSLGGLWSILAQTQCAICLFKKKEEKNECAEAQISLSAD